MEADRKRAVRRNTLLLVLVAALFYFGFIAMAVIRGS
jgi:hypothetical protein